MGTAKLNEAEGQNRKSSRINHFHEHVLHCAVIYKQPKEKYSNKKVPWTQAQCGAQAVVSQIPEAL